MSYEEQPYAWAEPLPAPDGRRTGRTIGAAALVVVIIAVAGAPLGVLWHFLAPTVPVLNAGAGGIVIGDPSPEQYIASDGWFAMLGLGFGLIAAVLAWMVPRRHRGPWLLGGAVLGTLAAAPVAWQAGRMIGRAAFQQWSRTSASGDTFQAPPDLHAYGVLLVPAFGAAIVLTLMAGWSNDPDLDVPGAKPGYSHNSPYYAGEPPTVSSGWPGGPDQPMAPAPPGPGPADPPRG